MKNDILYQKFLIVTEIVNLVWNHDDCSSKDVQDIIEGLIDKTYKLSKEK